MDKLTFKKQLKTNEDTNQELNVMPQIGNVKYEPINVDVNEIFVNFNVEGLVSEISGDDTIIFKIIIGKEITDYRFTATRSNDQKNPEVGEITTFRFGGLKEEFYSSTNYHIWLKSDWTRLSKYSPIRGFLDDDNEDELMMERYDSRKKKEIDIYVNKYKKKSKNSFSSMDNVNEVSFRNETDDFKWGGLSGEEAIIGFWNTD